MATRAGINWDILAYEIITGLRMPGDRLNGPRLTRQFDVSQTPVRKALVELATADLVEMRPYRST